MKLIFSLPDVLNAIKSYILSIWCSAVLILLVTHAPGFTQSFQQTGYAVSPATAEMVKVANVPLNLSAGVLDQTIPVYEIRSDDFSWPLQLRYSYAGLRLEELPGECGLGWSMAGLGGVVTREVRGLPDEHPRGFYGSENRRQYIRQFQSSADMPLNITQDFVSGLYDSEPDKFMVLAGDLSFSFFINAVNCESCPLADQQITVTSNSDLARVVFNWNGIEVTDSDGNVFRFEEHETASFFSSDVYNQEKMNHYTSAWYLTSIKVPTGRQIRFSYGKTLIRQIHHSETYDRTASPSGETIRVNCTALGGINNSGYNQDVFVREIAHQQNWSDTEVETPYLINIQWDQGNQLDILRIQQTPDILPLISGIEVKNSAGRIIKTISLNYEIQARPLLTQVTVNKEEIYDFSYYPVTVAPIRTPLNSNMIDPTQNPFAQDYWGFANGKSNPSAIPELGGDRRPDFKTALQGAMHTISWPTGGTTSIDYESNKIRMSAADYLEQEPDSPNRTYSFSLQSSQYRPATSTKTFVFDQVTFARISHQAYIKGTAAQLNAEFLPSTGCAGRNCQTYYTYADQMRSMFPDVVPRFYPVFGVALTGDVIQSGCNGFQACARESVDRWIRIEPGVYTMEASINNAEYGLIQLTVEFFDPDPNHLSPAYYDVSASGIRVKRTKDCPDPGSEAGCMQKIYRYHSEDGFSSGAYLSKLDQEFLYQIYDAVDCRERNGTTDPGAGTLPLFFEWNYPAVRKSFRSFNPVVFYAGSPVYYSRVEVRDDPDATFGKEIRHFRPTTYGLTGSYPYMPLPQDQIHGVVWKTEWRSSKDSLVRDLVTEHSVSGINETSSLPEGMVFGIARVYRYTPILFPDQLDQLKRESFIPRKYSAERSSRRLLSIETDQDRFGLTRKKFYKYNSRLQLASDSTVNSDSRSLVNRYTYPQDFTDPVHQKLVSLNRIAEPTVTSIIIDGVQRERRSTIYKDWNGNPEKIQPVRKEVLKDGVAVTEINFDQYGQKNKPISWIQRDGITRVLIWDQAQEELTAEVLGARPNEVFFTSFELGDREGNSVTGDSHTGKKSFSGSFVNDMTGLDPAKTYLLSWFEKDAKGLWQVRQQSVNPDSSGKYAIRLSGSIDDIRFHPAGAQMYSYTTEPLLGITSETDPGLKCTYYDYDAAGRLIAVRDADKNILSATTYQYGKQP